MLSWGEEAAPQPSQNGIQWENILHTATAQSRAVLPAPSQDVVPAQISPGFLPQPPELEVSALLAVQERFKHKEKAGKQGIAGAGIAVVPSSNWEMNEWEFQPQSPVESQTELCDFAHPNPQPGLSQRLQSSFPKQREPQKGGDFPLWESKLLLLGVFVIFLWQVIFIHELQEPDVGVRG